MDMNLRWMISDSASCFHAAAAFLDGQPLANAALAEAIAEPAEALDGELREAGLPLDQFHLHVVPLAAGIENNRELANVVLRKVVGGDRVASLTSPLGGRFSDLEAAVRRAIPNLVDRLTPQAEALKTAWQTDGPALLQAVARLTEERLIVEDADVVVVYPALGGGGAAHLPYNSVRIEAVPARANERLPEVVRLAWLLSQLNLEVPMFSEMIHGRRLPSVASLAMLPATLTAAAQLGHIPSEETMLGEAIRAWRLAGPDGADPTSAVQQWWDTYVASPPLFGVALAALDRML